MYFCPPNVISLQLNDWNADDTNNGPFCPCSTRPVILPRYWADDRSTDEGGISCRKPSPRHSVYVTVVELHEQFGISKPTLRRYLKKCKVVQVVMSLRANNAKWRPSPKRRALIGVRYRNCRVSLKSRRGAGAQLGSKLAATFGDGGRRLKQIGADSGKSG